MQVSLEISGGKEMARKVRLLGAMFMVTVFLISGSVFAQGAQYAQTTEYSFDDDVVQGDLVRPDGELTVARRKGKQSSLIKVRDNFIKEMLKSVEDL